MLVLIASFSVVSATDTTNDDTIIETAQQTETVQQAELNTNVLTKKDDNAFQSVKSADLKTLDITLEPIEDIYALPDNVTIAGTINSPESSASSVFPIDICVNGESISREYVYNNQSFEINYTVQIAGEYEVYVNYSGSDEYRPSTSGSVFFWGGYETSIKLDDIENVTTVNDTVMITGRLDSPHSPSNANFPVEVYVDHEIIGNAYTYENGYFSIEYTPSGIGPHTVTASYLGNDYYFPSYSNGVIFYVGYQSTIILEDIDDVNLPENEVTVKGTISSYGTTSLAGYPIDIYLNWDKVDRVFPNANGEFSTVIRVSTLGKNVVMARYEGLDDYLPALSNEVMFYHKSNSHFRLNPMEEGTPDEITVVTGQLVDDNGDPIDFFDIDLIQGSLIIDKYIRQQAVHDGNFILQFVPQDVGSYKLKVNFEGLDQYLPVSEEVVIKVTSDTILVIDPVNYEKIRYHDTVMVTGSLMDKQLKGIKGKIKLNFNNTHATVESEENGVFTYNYVVSKVGDINITAHYNGNEYYGASDDSRVINVDKQESRVVLNNISAVKSGTPVAITGQLVDAYGDGFYGTVKLLINNGRATVKTDENGYFSYEYTLSRVGQNNISAWYLESAKYEGSDHATISVAVGQLNTQIVFDKINPVKFGENVTIKGKLLDENGDAVVGTVKLEINGGRATVKTDENGEFSYVYPATPAGRMYISAEYLGNNRYNVSKASTGVNVSKIGTMIVIDPIDPVLLDTYVNITGQLRDENGNGIYGTVKLLINRGRATVKTDSNGFFTYQHNASRYGTSYITANFLETNRYLESQSKLIFHVKTAEYMG